MNKIGESSKVCNMSNSGEDPAFARGYDRVREDDAMTAEDSGFPTTQECLCRHTY